MNCHLFLAQLESFSHWLGLPKYQVTLYAFIVPDDIICKNRALLCFDMGWESILESSC
jgi:hypothetical protein